MDKDTLRVAIQVTLAIVQIVILLAMIRINDSRKR
jgi:hypothetical protein